jgi:RNA processing factor Prp31
MMFTDMSRPVTMTRAVTTTRAGRLGRRVTVSAAVKTSAGEGDGRKDDGRKGDGRVQDEIVRSLNAQLAEYKKTQQNAVVKYIRYEVKKQEIVDDHFDAMAKTRESIADQSRKYLRDLETLTDSRVSLALNCALADILKDLNELQREVDEWKIDQAPEIRGIFERMNEGLFFKKLYGESPPRPPPVHNTDFTAVSYLVILLAVVCVISR